MRRAVVIVLGIAGLALFLRRRARQDPVRIWFSDGSEIALRNREAAEIAEHAEDIPLMARER